MVSNQLLTIDIDTMNINLQHFHPKQVAPRKNHVAVMLGVYMLVHGGLDCDGEYLSDFRLYNTSRMC